jgi:methyl-accepting chemotaxis protein
MWNVLASDESTENPLASPKVVNDTLETANNLAKTSDDRFTANEHYILETQDKLAKTRNQVALVVEKVEQLEKKGRNVGPWIISILAFVGMVINWLI